MELKSKAQLAQEYFDKQVKYTGNGGAEYNAMLMATRNILEGVCEVKDCPDFSTEN